MGQERLQKLIARAGKWSRRQAEELIRGGHVTVNGLAATIGQQADPARDAVKVDGNRLHIPVSAAGIHVLLNKPPGYISTRRDPEGRPTVLDLLPARMRDTVRPVGRLDFNTEGLLLLTDDGDLANRIAHPRFGCVKSYEVKVKGTPDREALARLRTGIKLEGKMTAPARVESRRVRGSRELSTNTWWTIAINEGRTRQIREMLFRVGHPVQRLRRVAIGPLRDAALRLGDWRMVTAEEIERLTSSLSQGTKGAPCEGAPSAPAGRAKRPRATPRAPRTGKSGTAKFDTGRLGSEGNAAGSPSSGKTRPGKSGPGRPSSGKPRAGKPSSGKPSPGKPRAGKGRGRRD